MKEEILFALTKLGIPLTRQDAVPVIYKGATLSAPLRLDLRIAGKVIGEVKAKENLAPAGKPQILTYLRLTGLRRGLIINFHTPVLVQGMHRIVNGLPDELNFRAQPDT